MKEMLRSLFESRGLSVNEEELEQLTVNWESLNQLKASMEQVKLADFNSALVHVPKGGAGHE